MNKFLRLTLVAILALVWGGVNAQTVFDFDNDYKTLFPKLPGVSSGTSSNDGDFTEATTCEVDGVKITVSAKASGTNENRIWSGSPRLRMYTGTLTVEAPAGKKLNSIMFTAKSGKFNITPDKGTLTETTWEGSESTVVFTVNGNTQIKNITVYIDGEKPVDISNTPEKAYSVAKAKELIAAGQGLSTKVYVKGLITGIKDVETEKYGNATYYINDNNSTDGQITVFRGFYLNGDKFTSEDQIKVGDEVIVYGTLTLYNNTENEIADSQLYSIKSATTGITAITPDKAADENAPMYNLAGQRVGKGYKGVVIKNGKKYIVK